MKTGAPGPFECEVYLKAWQLDIRGPDVMRHVDSCLWCGTLINGHPGEFPLPIAEEARRNLERRAAVRAQTRARSRRRFLATAATVLGLAGLGSTLWMVRSSGPGVTPTPQLDLQQQNWDRNLSRLYSTQGAVGVRARMALMDAEELRLAAEWIREKRHALFYADLVTLLGDVRPDVPRIALTALCKIDPAALRPHEAALLSAAEIETDTTRRRAIRSLLQRIKDS